MAMDTGAGVGLAAAKAGMHRNTAARHRASGLLPSEASVHRTYRTHADVFEADWPGIVQKLRESPGFVAEGTEPGTFIAKSPFGRVSWSRAGADLLEG